MTERPDRAPRAAPHPLLDRGGLAVLAILLFAFVAPAVVWMKLGPPLPSAPGPSPFELQASLGCSLLALLLPLLSIFLMIRQRGGPAVLTGALARIGKAHTNLLEALLPFAAVVLTARTLGVSTRLTLACAAVFLAARLVHATTFSLGIVVIRSAAFYAGSLATALLAAQVFVALH